MLTVKRIKFNMRYLFLIIASVGFLMVNTGCYDRAYANSVANLNTQAETTVYVCTGPQSKRFHKTSHCRGLNSCSGDILAVSISKAKSMGRTPCKWCYK